MRHRPRLLSGLLQPSPLLVTESPDLLAQIREEFDKTIAPREIIEHMYVADIVHLTWDILRYRRCKTAIINTEFREALERLLPRLLRQPEEHDREREDEVAELALGWFVDAKTKEQVSNLLKQFGLNESAIEADAIMTLGDNLEQLDRLLASSESRRNKALRGIAEYRDALAQQLRQTSDRITDGKVLALEDFGSKKPSAA